MTAETAPIVPKTLSLPYVHDVVWDGTRSRLFASAGTTIVRINPGTAEIEDTIASGEVAGRVAVSADGQYLYAAIGSRGIIKRYQVDTHAQDLVINLGKDSQGRYLTAAAMIALPGRSESILIARGYWPAIEDYLFAITSQDVAVYDREKQRPDTMPLDVSSLHVRSSDGLLYGWGKGKVYRLTVTAGGVAVDRSSAISPLFSKDSLPAWNGGLLLDRAGMVFDLGTSTLLGQAPITAGCALTPDASGSSILAAHISGSGATQQASLVRYSVETFRASASVGVIGNTDFPGACDFVSRIVNWGSDGIAISAYQHSGGGSQLIFLRATEFDPIARPAPPEPQKEESGLIRLAIPANDLAFDASRNLVWATVPGNAGQIGNSVVSIDPASGRILDTIAAGSEPGGAALSTDGTRLFVMSTSAPLIHVFDLNARQRVQTFSVADSEWRTPASLAAVPDQNNAVAVVRLFTTPSYSGDIVVYDGGVPRPHLYANSKDLPWLTAIYPGDAPNTFYAANLDHQYADGSRDVARLVVNADGISLDRQLNALDLGDASYFGTRSHNLAYDSGHLFTSGGQVWTPDTQVLEGAYDISQSYAASGIPVPFPARNQVAYLHESGLTNKIALTLFDVSTQRPLATMPMPSPATTAIAAGDRTIAVTGGGQITLVPLDALPPWPQYSPVLKTVTSGVQKLDIRASAINALPGSSKLVVALPGAAGAIGNSVAVLDPATGHIERSAFVGSEPSMLRTARDGSAAYAYVSGERRIARFDIASASRDLIFPADPTGGSAQYAVVDMALGPDGGLTISLNGGWLATFDNGVARPDIDKNTEGTGAYSGAPYHIALNDAGTMVYAADLYWSFLDFKREAVTPSGIRWLSGTSGLVSSAFQYAGGLLYQKNGAVVDPERSRLVGHLDFGWCYDAQIAPEPAAGRIYAVCGGQLMIYDSNTYAKLASWNLPNSYNLKPQDLVRFGSDGLAFRTVDGELYLVQISAIPLLAAPVPSPQPALPVTEGVTVVDLAANDIVYDSARNLIYASVPNAEGAMGDHIVAIDPGTGAIVTRWVSGRDPRVLALSDDQNHLYYAAGAGALGFYSGFSPTSEAIIGFDLSAAVAGSAFPKYETSAGFSYSVRDMAVLPGQPKSVAAIDVLTQSAGGAILNTPGSMKVYDDGVARSKPLLPRTFSCGHMVFGASASRLYCSSGAEISRVGVDEHGLRPLGSIRLLPGRGAFGHMAYREGRIYTTTGLVVNADAGTVIRRLKTQGPVAVDDALAYWLDPSQFTREAPNVVLRAFDVSTFEAMGTKRINVTKPDAGRLIACGEGRVAFNAGNEIYIVRP